MLMSRLPLDAMRVSFILSLTKGMTNRYILVLLLQNKTPLLF